jgi:uncharacterized surface protein with fasciclin (FAS1) repeats
LQGRTVFAPHDDAFVKVPFDLQPALKELMRDERFLLGHVVHGKLSLEQMASTGGKVETTLQ